MNANYQTEKVSVIIPSYNTPENELIRCLESVLNQTHGNLEIIIIDDGSTIAFSEVDKKYFDNRIVWHKLEKNVGLAAARNAGLLLSTGNYIAFLDSDDWWKKEKIGLQIEKFNQAGSKKLGVVYCGVCTVNRNSGRQKIKKPNYKDNIYENLLVRQVVTGSGSSVMIKRSVYEDVGGFFDKFDLPQDREYWMRIAKNGWLFDFVASPLVYIDLHDNSLSSDPLKKGETFKRLLFLYEKDLITFNKYHAAWAHYYFEIGKKHFRKRKYPTGIKLFFTAALRHYEGILVLGREYINKKIVKNA